MTLDPNNHDLRLGLRGRVRCEPGWHLGSDWSKSLKDYDLWYIWEGKGQIKIDSDQIELHPGVCLWMQPGRRYEAKQDIFARLSVTFIHFSVVSKEGTLLPLSVFQPPFEVVRTRQVGFIDSLMRRIVQLESEPESEASAEHLMKALIIELAREHRNTPRHEPLATEQHHREIVLATAAKIRESPAESPSIVELAHAAGYSVDHFSRIFLKIIGLRPQHYIIQAKIERASQLLLESNLTIGAISEVVGFQDIFYFSRQFKQKTGQNPSQYRKALRSA